MPTQGNNWQKILQDVYLEGRATSFAIYINPKKMIFIRTSSHLTVFFNHYGHKRINHWGPERISVGSCETTAWNHLNLTASIYWFHSDTGMWQRQQFGLARNCQEYNFKMANKCGNLCGKILFLFLKSDLKKSNLTEDLSVM